MAGSFFESIPAGTGTQPWRREALSGRGEVVTMELAR